jgi:hypothetical protein
MDAVLKGNGLAMGADDWAVGIALAVSFESADGEGKTDDEGTTAVAGVSAGLSIWPVVIIGEGYREPSYREVVGSTASAGACCAFRT